MKKVHLIAELASLGIEVKDGKIRKADIVRVLASKLNWGDINKAIEGTDFEGAADDQALKKIFEEHADLLSSLDPRELRTLFSGDYHKGSESHSFPHDKVDDIKLFNKDAGEHLGWDPESYEEESDTCPECGMDLEGYDTCTNCDPESGQ